MKLVWWLASKVIIKGEIDVLLHILCDSCRLARGNQRPLDVEPMSRGSKAKIAPTVKPRMKVIKGGHLSPGDYVSIDQYTSSYKGRLPTGYGIKASNSTYGGGTIFVDHASSFINVEHQITLFAGDTIR
mmetsp:Transcript_1209/g.1946  ORF Transcript_1209/g.1946 Transcript_1209/m.1946 type:complete len:129 (-) Transcript_1209:632-1018(-)